MTKINKILNYIYIFIGFIIVVYFIYVRLLLVRLPRDLHFNASGNIYIMKMVLLLFSIIVCIYVIIKNIKIVLKIIEKQTKITKLASFFSEITEKSLKEFCAFILSFHKDRYELLSNLSRKFYNFWHVYPEYYLLFVIYVIRVIILIVFLLEIFLTFQFKYFYKSLMLICIVLFIKFVIFVLKDFASNLEVYDDVLIIEDEGVDEKTQLQTINYTLHPDYKNNDINYVVREYVLCNKLTGYLDMYKRYSDFFSPRINLIIYPLYLIGWCYVLFFNL